MGSSSEVLMVRHQSRTLLLCSAIGVPLLSFLSPSWLTLMGVGPSWEVLWLLPWALVEGPVSGVWAGLSLGLILDALSLGDGTQVPALVLLGFWWGWLGRRGSSIDKIFSLGLLACLGSLLVGISFWLQLLITKMSEDHTLFNMWSLNTLLSQVILTGLLAPIFCSWLLLIFRRSKVIP